MKYLLMILLVANMLLAIEQVPHRTNSTTAEDSETTINAKQSGPASGIRKIELREKTYVQKKELQPDVFIDNNSNGVNDRREDDFQIIKTKKSKHKDMIEQQQVERPEPKQKEKTPTKAREKTSGSSEKKKEK
jgi:hypothetical protein